jgi:hypothetical protein
LEFQESECRKYCERKERQDREDKADRERKDREEKEERRREERDKAEKAERDRREEKERQERKDREEKERIERKEREEKERKDREEKEKRDEARAAAEERARERSHQLMLEASKAQQALVTNLLTSAQAKDEGFLDKFLKLRALEPKEDAFKQIERAMALMSGAQGQKSMAAAAATNGVEKLVPDATLNELAVKQAGFSRPQAGCVPDKDQMP